MKIVFKFFNLLLHKKSDLVNDLKLKSLAQAFPDTMAKVHTFRSVNRDNFETLIVCQKCHSTFDSDDCCRDPATAKCSFVRFPRHSQARMQRPCGTSLMKPVKTSARKTIYIPIKVFCTCNMIESIQHYVLQDGYLDMFSHWRQGEVVPIGVLAGTL